MGSGNIQLMRRINRGARLITSESKSPPPNFLMVKFELPCKTNSRSLCLSPIYIEEQSFSTMVNRERNNLLDINFEYFPNTKMKGVERQSQANIRGVMCLTLIKSWNKTVGSTSHLVFFDFNQNLPNFGTFVGFWIIPLRNQSVYGRIKD